MSAVRARAPARLVAVPNQQCTAALFMGPCKPCTAAAQLRAWARYADITTRHHTCMPPLYQPAAHRHYGAGRQRCVQLIPKRM